MLSLTAFTLKGGLIMKVVISSRNFSKKTLKEEQKVRIEKKLEKLEKYFHGQVDTSVVLFKRKNDEKLEITVRSGKQVFRAESAGESIDVCIDKAINKLLSQIHKFKGKLEKKYKDHDSIRFKELDKLYSGEKEIDEIFFEKRKSVKPQPISIEDAVMEMELVDHNFYVFTNDKTGMINVVYKRRDGGYGLIETEK
ncbi:ribosomal subunit interface protein [Eubacterium brachy ATCC 33089]|jgi:ribosomal subunit interface protein|nr:ribosomal subunit interface protein [Eubacterium brachy ATCC 33089]